MQTILLFVFAHVISQRSLFFFAAYTSIACDLVLKWLFGLPDKHTDRSTTPFFDSFATSTPHHLAMASDETASPHHNKYCPLFKEFTQLTPTCVPKAPAGILATPTSLRSTSRRETTAMRAVMKGLLVVRSARSRYRYLMLPVIEISCFFFPSCFTWRRRLY